MIRPYNRLFAGKLATAATIAFACAVPLSIAAPPSGKVTDIGIQQQRIQRDFQELEQKILRVITELEPTDPERARQLRKALDWSRDKILSGRLGVTADLLNASRLAEAGQLQSPITADLDRMLRLLQEEGSEYDRLQERLDQLQEWLDRATSLARDEWRQLRETERAIDPAGEQKRLSEQTARAERLLAAQKALRDRTGQAQTASDSAALDRAAAEQKGLEKDTRALAEDIRQQAKTPETSPDTRVPEAGEQSLDAAADAQAQSAENLAAGEPKPSLDKQADAIRNLEKALAELKKESERQKPRDNAKAQAAQDRTGEQTEALSQDMAAAESQQNEQQPGQSSVRKAQQSMRQASSQLGQSKPAAATPEQEEAHKQMAQAADDLKKEIKKTQEEQRDALRRLLSDMFEKMLLRQKSATLRTGALDEKKQKRPWTDEDRRELADIRETESDLGRMAGQAWEMVTRDGSAVVFGTLLTEVRQTLSNVVVLIDGEETGLNTRTHQREVEELLTDLLKALEATENLPPPEEKDEEPPPEGEPKTPPLIAVSEELRLLKAQQIRVNERTTAVEKQFVTTHQAEVKADLRRLTDRQRRIFEMTEELMRKLTRETTQ